MNPATTAAAAATNRAVGVASGQLTPLAFAPASGASFRRRLRSTLRVLSSTDSERSINTSALLRIHGPRSLRPLGSAAIRISRQAVTSSAKKAAEATEAGETAPAAAAAAAPSESTTTAVRQISPAGRRGLAASLGNPKVKPPPAGKAAQKASADKAQGAALREARSRIRQVKGAASDRSLLAIPLVPSSEKTIKGYEKKEEEEREEEDDDDDFEDDFDDDDDDDDGKKKKKKKSSRSRIKPSEAHAKASAKHSPAWLQKLDEAEIQRQRLELEADRQVKLAARLHVAPRVSLSAVSARNARARASRSNHDPLAKKSFEVYLEKERELAERKKLLSLPDKGGEDGEKKSKARADDERSNYAALADPEREQWWGVQLPEPDARKAGAVARWLEAAPSRLPFYTGTVEAWVPKKSVKAWSFKANKMGKRVVAFRDGAVVFFRAKMDQQLGDYIANAIIDQTKYNEREMLTGRVSGYTKSVKFPGLSDKRQVPVPLGDDSDDGGELLAEAREWAETEELWDRAASWAYDNPDGLPMPSLLDEMEGRRKSEEMSGKRMTAEEAAEKAEIDEVLSKLSDEALTGLDHIAKTAVVEAAASSALARRATRRAAEGTALSASVEEVEGRGGEQAGGEAGEGRGGEQAGGEAGEENQPGFSKRVAEASRLAAAASGAAAAGWNVGAPPPSLADRYYVGGGGGGGRGGRGGGRSRGRGRGQGSGFREREREYAPRGGASGGRAGGGGYGRGWASNSSNSSRGGGGSFGRDYDSFDSFAGGYDDGGGDGGYDVGGAWGNAAGVDADAGAAAARDFYESDAAAALGGGGDSWESSPPASVATSHDDDDHARKGYPYPVKGSFESAFESLLGLGDGGGGGTFSANKAASSRKDNTVAEGNRNEDPASWFDEGLEWE